MKRTSKDIMGEQITVNPKQQDQWKQFTLLTLTESSKLLSSSGRGSEDKDTGQV